MGDLEIKCETATPEEKNNKNHLIINGFRLLFDNIYDFFVKKTSKAVPTTTSGIVTIFVVIITSFLVSYLFPSSSSSNI